MKTFEEYINEFFGLGGALKRAWQYPTKGRITPQAARQQRQPGPMRDIVGVWKALDHVEASINTLTDPEAKTTMEAMLKDFKSKIVSFAQSTVRAHNQSN